ncbi:MAG: hemolysin III family protein [Lachnospiraceae bacterium]|nr:hemolysin III family protein [Lachnospiraceae bacterium]
MSTANCAVMTAKPKKEIAFMDYNLAEELISAISHGLGAGLAIAASVLCIVRAAKTGSAWSVVSCSVFGFTLIMLYSISTIYHSLARNKAKQIFRVIDHCSVFLLIAGTYTPFVLVSLNGAAGWVLFGIIWGLAALGIVFNAIDVDKYEVISAVINVLMGWAIIFMVKPLWHVIGTGGIVFLITGGVAYTVGAILYGIGNKIRYMHSVFHFFCLAGSICHFFAIFSYVL